MLQAALRSGRRATGAASSRSSPAGCPRAAATASSPAPAGCSRRSSTSASATTSCAACADADGRRRADAGLAGRLPLLRRHLRLRRGRVLLPRLAAARGRGRPSPRACCWRRWSCRSSTTTAAIAAAASRMIDRRRRPALHRDGLAAHARAGGGRRRPRRLRRRVRGHHQPRGRPPLRRPDRRHRRARLHPAARRRARGVRGAGGLASARARPCSSTPTTCRRRSSSRSRSPGPSWAPCGSTPATC